MNQFYNIFRESKFLQTTCPVSSWFLPKDCYLPTTITSSCQRSASCTMSSTLPTISGFFCTTRSCCLQTIYPRWGKIYKGNQIILHFQIIFSDTICKPGIVTNPYVSTDKCPPLDVAIPALRDRCRLQRELHGREIQLLYQREHMLLEQQLHHREQLLWDQEQFRRQQLIKREQQFRCNYWSPIVL